MIQKLEYITGKDGNGNVYGAIPSDAEIIAKINEVIDVLNQMLKREERGWIMIPPDATIEGIDSLLKQVRKKFQQEQLEVDLEKEIDDYLEPIKAWQIQEAPFTSMENCARHFAKWGRKQVLQEIYDGKVKPVDKITAAWIDDESKAKEE